jgi:membrane dipeptidase
MEFQANGSRRHFLSTAATAAGAAMLLRPGLGLAAEDVLDPRVAGIVAKTIGIDTHNHVDVPLTAPKCPGPI